MLSETDIQTALHASRVVPVPVANPHGPLGLEHLAACLQRIVPAGQDDGRQVRCPITLPLDTWQKLAAMARELEKRQSRPVAPSDLAAALVVQTLAALYFAETVESG
jgi:hypothetical protein